MFFRYACLSRLILTLFLSFVLVRVIYVYRCVKQSTRSIPSSLTKNNNELLLVRRSHDQQWPNNTFVSLFQMRTQRRWFNYGQQFSHINIDRLLSIQKSSRQTLTYVCSKHCGGWGDRLRGITSTYMLAVFLQRRFLIDISYPCRLTDFLRTNLIDWQLSNIKSLNVSLRLDLMHPNEAREFNVQLSSGNLNNIWSQHDHIYLTTNTDYITPLLTNPSFSSIKSQLNIQSNESTQGALFPLIFELLFQPMSIVVKQLDRLLKMNIRSSSTSTVCLHVRLGQNPSIPKDEKILFREKSLDDMITFIDRNVIQQHSLIFVTSDSARIQQKISEHYGRNRTLIVPGPILHIDRLNSQLDSKEIIHRGFLKVIVDFYFLGECDTLIKSRSGFSDWANYRRLNPYRNLFIYCRGLHHVNSSNWHRPHSLC
jgi:hypothetical protein